MLRPPVYFICLAKYIYDCVLRGTEVAWTVTCLGAYFAGRVEQFCKALTGHPSLVWGPSSMFKSIVIICIRNKSQMHRVLIVTVSGVSLPLTSI